MHPIRIVVYLIVSILFYIHASAQPLNLTLLGAGSYTTEPSSHSIVPVDGGFIDLATTVKGNIFSKSSSIGFNLRITLYTRDMEIQKEEKIEAEKFPNGPFNPSLAIVGGKPMIVFHRYDLDAKEQTLCWAPIDAASLAIGTAKELLRWSQTNQSMMDLDPEYRAHHVRFATSADGSKLVVFRYSGTMETFRFAVFDKDMTLLWSTMRSAPIKSQDIYPGDLCVSNSGRVYFTYTMRNYPSRPNAFVVTMDKGLDQLITVSNEQLTQVLIRLAADQQTLHIVGGIFDKNGNMKGVYRAKVEGAVPAVVGFQPTLFTDQFQEDFNLPAYARNTGHPRGVPPCGLKLVELSDGTLAMAGIAHLSGKESGLQLGSSVLFVRFGTGEPFIGKVPRFWRSFTGYGVNTNVVAYGNAILVLYNDSRPNIARPLEKEPVESDYQHAVLVAAIIAPDGSVQRSLAVDQVREGFMAMPEYSIQSGKSLYVAFWKKKGLGIPGRQTRWAVVTQP